MNIKTFFILNPQNIIEYLYYVNYKCYIIFCHFFDYFKKRFKLCDIDRLSRFLGSKVY